MNRIDRRSVLGALGAAATFSLAGCSGDGGGTTTEQGLLIRNGDFAISEITSYRSYRTAPTQIRGQRTFFYFELEGYETQDSDTFSEKFDLTEELTVTDADGETMVDRSIDLNEDPPSDASLEQFYFTNRIDIPDDAPLGEYTWEITVTDELGSDTDSETYTFEVSDPEA